MLPFVHRFRTPDFMQFAVHYQLISLHFVTEFLNRDTFHTIPLDDCLTHLHVVDGRFILLKLSLTYIRLNPQKPTQQCWRIARLARSQPICEILSACLPTAAKRRAKQQNSKQIEQASRRKGKKANQLLELQIPKKWVNAKRKPNQIHSGRLFARCRSAARNSSIIGQLLWTWDGLCDWCAVFGVLFERASGVGGTPDRESGRCARSVIARQIVYQTAVASLGSAQTYHAGHARHCTASLVSGVYLFCFARFALCKNGHI